MAWPEVWYDGSTQAGDDSKIVILTDSDEPVPVSVIDAVLDEMGEPRCDMCGWQAVVLG